MTPMTVAELIDELRKCPPELPVVTVDYEEGDIPATAVFVKDDPPRVEVS